MLKLNCPSGRLDTAPIRAIVWRRHKVAQPGSPAHRRFLPTAVTVLLFGGLGTAFGQEAKSGLELRATLTQSGSYTHDLEEEPRSGPPVTGGFRAVLYPTWKLSRNWTVSGAVQVHSRPHFFEEFYTQGYGVKGDILQAHLTYSRFWKSNSVAVRVGQLSSAFGSFLLRYDDAANPLIDAPVSYGYYEKPVSVLGLAGAQVEAAFSKLDLRAQFTNSSPANRRSILDKEQYGNWTAGAGCTLRQGFRVGVSGYRGPYLHRGHEDYSPAEGRPRDLTASGYGADVQWAGGHWNANGEFHRFQMSHRAIPSIKQTTAYVEIRRILHPRWYIAARLGYLRDGNDPRESIYETVVGFRPNAHQLIKAGYQIRHEPGIEGSTDRVLAVQVVTTLRPIAVARD